MSEKCKVYKEQISPLPGGYKILSGLVTPANNTYGSTGNDMNLSNHFAAGATPMVIVASTGGAEYKFSGNATAGKLIAYYVAMNAQNGAHLNAVMVPCANADLSASNAQFIAIGKSA